MSRTLVGLALLLGGCGDPWLDGSLPALLDLQTEETRARLYGSELELAWMDLDRPGGVAVRVTVPADDLTAGEALPLVPDGSLTLGDHLEVSIPDVAEGSVRLSRWPLQEGDPVRARFRATLEEVDGLQLTAVGRTDAPLEVVDAL
jgi:hypothetical protein